MGRLIQYINEEEAEQLRKWGKTFGKNHGKYPDEHGFFDLCVEHMTGNIDDPEAYCARVKDIYSKTTYWRSGSKKEK